MFCTRQGSALDAANVQRSFHLVASDELPFSRDSSGASSSACSPRTSAASRSSAARSAGVRQRHLDGWVLSCRPDCVSVLVVDVVVLVPRLRLGFNVHPEEICSFLSRLVASQIAALSTPFAYLTLRTVLPVRNGIQPEAHSPSRYVSSDG
jgi:hypothetical protein